MTTKKKLSKKTMIDRLKRSPAYRVAYHDGDFLESGQARPVRLQLELLKTEVGMRKHDIKSTIVVFGGTRILEPKEAQKAVKLAEARVRKYPDDRELKKKLRIARSILAKSGYYDEAREFGRLVSEDCQQNSGREFVIVTGGGPGIMEAANRGAYDVGAKSVGLNITLPMEQQPNQYISPELCYQFHYFAIRKMHFLMRAKALVAFPGGYGTMDELFEALTLVQVGKTPPIPIILFGEKFWRKLIDFKFLVEQGTIAEDDLKLFVFADKAKDAWEYIRLFHQSEDVNGKAR